MKSEFGKGFIYNIFLFAKHWGGISDKVKTYKEMREKYPNTFSEDEAYEMWFYGASDHFAEFEIPKQFEKKKIGKLSKQLSNDIWNLRGTTSLQRANEKDFENVFERLEQLVILIDKELGITDKEAEHK